MIYLSLSQCNPRKNFLLERDVFGSAKLLAHKIFRNRQFKAARAEVLLLKLLKKRKLNLGEERELETIHQIVA